ncbi:MAG: hypothetical protein IKE95_03625 [Methanobrevibacter sp.]|nr:hypothetical protein [Methanobrevibacter sp.]
MTITVISQTTAERREETARLYARCKPYLDQGYSIHKAAWTVTGTQPTNSKNGWYRELIDYAISQGYDYYGNKWKRCTVVERTSTDVDKETKELFEKCKPYLDEGKGFYEACRIVRNIPETSSFGNRSWYKRFREYAKTQGYTPLR